jgi:hypothetical protein
VTSKPIDHQRDMIDSDNRKLAAQQGAHSHIRGSLPWDSMGRRNPRGHRPLKGIIGCRNRNDVSHRVDHRTTVQITGAPLREVAGRGSRIRPSRTSVQNTRLPPVLVCEVRRNSAQKSIPRPPTKR